MLTRVMARNATRRAVGERISARNKGAAGDRVPTISEEPAAQRLAWRDSARTIAAGFTAKKRGPCGAAGSASRRLAPLMCSVAGRGRRAAQISGAPPKMNGKRAEMSQRVAVETESVSGSLGLLRIMSTSTVGCACGSWACSIVVRNTR